MARVALTSDCGEYEGNTIHDNKMVDKSVTKLAL